MLHRGKTAITYQHGDVGDEKCVIRDWQSAFKRETPTLFRNKLEQLVSKILFRHCVLRIDATHCTRGQIKGVVLCHCQGYKVFRMS